MRQARVYYGLMICVNVAEFFATLYDPKQSVTRTRAANTHKRTRARSSTHARARTHARHAAETRGNTHARMPTTAGQTSQGREGAVAGPGRAGKAGPQGPAGPGRRGRRARQGTQSSQCALSRIVCLCREPSKSGISTAHKPAGKREQLCAVAGDDKAGGRPRLAAFSADRISAISDAGGLSAVRDEAGCTR